MFVIKREKFSHSNAVREQAPIKAKKNSLLHTILLGTLFLCTGVLSSQAQNLSTKGKDFWVGFIRNAHETDVTLHVYISADFATTGTISIPLVAWSVDFTVSANSTTDIIVPTALGEPDQNQINLPMGIHVVTDTIVSVYALNYEAFTADATVIIPTPSLGYDYYVVSNIGLNAYGFPSEFSVVSLTDSTIIEITPSAVTTAGNAAGTPFTIVLDAGEVYQVQEGYNLDYYGELTGTRVRAVDSINCHKFALFAGTQCSYLPQNTPACDQLYEQMVPINKWGKNYYTVPLASRLSDFIRVVASVDNTQFTVNGGSPITLNAGTWYDYTESTATIFSADKPVSVAQYSPSYGWDYQNGDPFMIMINPIEQHLNLITFNAFPSNVITNYYLNVVSPTSATGIITLDGSLIGAANFTAFANDPIYSFAQLDIIQGNHTLQSDSGFTATVYGFGGYESFGYSVGSNLNVLPLSFDIVYNGDTINYLAFHDTVGCPGYFTVIAHGDTSYTSYQWDFGDGTFGSGAIVDHTYNANGTYTITLSGFAAGQCAPDQVSIVITEGSVFNLNPSFDITYNGSTSIYSNFFDTLLCNYTVNFAALLDSLAYDYYWNFGNGDTASGPNVTYTFDSAGVYHITLFEQGDSCHQGAVHWTIVVAGGNNLDPFYYIIYNGDTTRFSDFNTTIGCHRDFEFIGYYDPTVISWNWNFGDGTTGSGQDVFHTYTSAGDYVVTMSTEVLQDCLDTTISRTLHIVDSITVDIPDMPLCYQATITMEATTSGNPDLQWSTGSTSSSIQIDQPGTYSITATLDQCLVTDTAIVTSIPKIENFLPALDSVCTASGEPAMIGCLFGLSDCDFSQYLWSTGDTTATINVDTAGIYSVQVVDENGCKGADTEQVVLYCPPFVIFPLAFSPNGDGINDGFGPQGLHIVAVTFTIYNRWGAVLYTGNNLTDRWNGKYKGAIQPLDVYVYTCSYTNDVNPGATYQLAGNVTLVR